MEELLPPWTASTIDMYLSCPHKYYRLRVKKDVKDTMGEKALWGCKVHKSFELAVNEDVALPYSIKDWAPLVQKIKSLPGEKFAEHRFALDENFKPTPWKLAWSRGIADLVVRQGKTVVLLDYKTGKRKPSEQLGLYAAYVFATWPDVETVHTSFVWLPDRKFDKKTYTRADTAKIWDEWLPAVARMRNSYETGKWPMLPSGLCRGWCPCKDCKYYEDKK